MRWLVTLPIPDLQASEVLATVRKLYQPIIGTINVVRVNQTSEDAPGKGKGIAEQLIQGQGKENKFSGFAWLTGTYPESGAGSPGDRIVFSLMWRNWKLPASVGNSN